MTKRIYDHDLIINDYKQGLSLLDLHQKYGICGSAAYQIICSAKCGRSISEALLLKSSGQTEWHKLIRVQCGGTHPKPAGTRLISLPKQFIMSLGFNPDHELFGKWELKKSGLLLSIKTKEKP